MTGTEPIEKEERGIKWHSILPTIVSTSALIIASFSLYQNYTKPRFVTISVPKVIESQVKNVDKEMIANKTMPGDAQLQNDVEKYTEKISTTIQDYTKKNNLIVFEKGSIISSGVEIEDITDAFIKAINE